MCILFAYEYVGHQILLRPKELNSLLVSPGVVIIVEDFDAKHTAWSSMTSNARGRELWSYVDARDDLFVVSGDRQLSLMDPLWH